MLNANKDLWLVRAGESGYLIDEFINKGIIAIGWNDLGDLSSYKNKEEIKQAIRNTYPKFKKGKVRSTAGQLFRFCFEFNKGDYAITYNTEKRIYHIGKIKSSYKYKESIIPDMNHIREVKWSEKIERDNLSPSAKNTLGSALTIIQVNKDVFNELDNLLEGENTVIEEDETEEELDIIKEDIIQKAHEFIKDEINNLSWEELEELVAGLLRGMGYKTRITPTGPDRGRDVIASPDGLGLGEPRIICEVKHRSSSMGSNQIRSFTGGLRNKDKGLYISTGGFTQEAKYEAERSNIPITLIDSDSLVNLIIQYYDDFDVESKSILPLKKIYWPT